MEFFAPDAERFPALSICYDALRRGGAAPIILNAANEAAVAAFLDGAIKFTAIPGIAAETLGVLDLPPPVGLADVFLIDAEARARASEICNQSAKNSA